MHGVLEVRGRKVIGGGDEWFLATTDELKQIHKLVTGL
jgi:hypothetical protein